VRVLADDDEIVDGVKWEFMIVMALTRISLSEISFLIVMKIAGKYRLLADSVPLARHHNVPCTVQGE
jgi:hypothetical protein